jgi:hypothetical protein
LQFSKEESARSKLCQGLTEVIVDDDDDDNDDDGMVVW